MSNSYYNHTTFPTPNSTGSSAQMRAQFDLVTAGFALLPTLTGNGYKVAMIAADGSTLMASSALQALAITSSTIDSTPIGATTATTGKFTDLTITGNAILGTGTVITGGSINSTIIGNTTPAAGYFTTLAASSGFSGNLTGNTSGTHTGAVIGNVTGNVTGNVSASSGTSAFNDVTINGNLDMNAGSAATITGLSTPTNAGDAANKGYVDTQDALKLALAGGTMSGAIAMGTNRITGLGDPSGTQDAATKNYVDSVAQGLDAKASCRVTTTANISLSGTQTIDGIAVIAGDRILVKDQSTTSQNGIYVVAAGAWSRSTDADSWTELVSAFTFVEQGTSQANNGYTCTVAAGGTLDTTAVTWVQFSGAGQITAGAGLTKTGNTLDVVTASSARIVVNADNIDLATTGVTATTYAGLAIDTYGRVTSASTLTTLSGYGITDAYTKTQIDTTVSGLLAKTGGTMSGAIAMGTNKITGVGDPTLAQDAATKNYIDTIFGSTSSAAASAAAAATSATNANNSATAAAGSATAASGSATSALGYLNTFKGQYYGSLASDPTLDPLGAAMTAGDLYFNTTVLGMKVYTGSAWLLAYLPSTGYLALSGGTMTGAITFAGAQTWPTFNQSTTGTAAGLSATLAVASGGTGSTTSTGSGSVVLATSPTLVTPLLGTPTSGNFSTGTFTWPTFNQNTSGTAAGLSATLAIASGGTGLTATGTSGNVLTSNGTAWVSQAPAVSLPLALYITLDQSYGGF